MTRWDNILDVDVQPTLDGNDPSRRWPAYARWDERQYHRHWKLQLLLSRNHWSIALRSKYFSSFYFRTHLLSIEWIFPFTSTKLPVHIIYPVLFIFSWWFCTYQLIFALLSHFPCWYCIHSYLFCIFMMISMKLLLSLSVFPYVHITYTTRNTPQHIPTNFVYNWPFRQFLSLYWLCILYFILRRQSSYYPTYSP